MVESISDWITEADQDGDSQLNKIEWRALTRRAFPEVPEADRQQWVDRDFAYYDSDGNGVVEARELTSLSLEGFDCHDTDGDGHLSDAEISAMSLKKCPGREITIS